MNLMEIVFLILGLLSPWGLWNSITGAIDEIRQIRRCTAEVRAQILSWDTQEYAEEATDYIPNIRYTYDHQTYQTSFRDRKVEKRGLERYEADNTIPIWVCPEDPSIITRENKALAVFNAIGNSIIWCGISLFFLLIAILLIRFKLR